MPSLAAVRHSSASWISHHCVWLPRACSSSSDAGAAHPAGEVEHHIIVEGKFYLDFTKGIFQNPGEVPRESITRPLNLWHPKLLSARC